MAEGIEDLQAVAELVTFGCDLAQAFHFAPPMTATVVTDFLQRAPLSDPVEAAVGSP